VAIERNPSGHLDGSTAALLLLLLALLRAGAGNAPGGGGPEGQGLQLEVSSDSTIHDVG